MPELDDIELPTHPRTGLQAIGLRSDGRPIWPILGAAEGDDDTDDDDTSGDGAGDSAAAGDGAGEDGDEPLGPPGVKALQAEKEKRRAAQQQLREYSALGLTPEQIKALVAGQNGAGNAEGAPDVESVRREAREEARAEAMRDKALDKLEAKAARLFQNPEDARAFLSDKVNDFIDDGAVDVEAINAALADLLKQRPYLGVAQGDGRRFSGTGDGGPRGGSPAKGQVSEDELKRMSPEQIVKARAEGRLKNLLTA